MCSAFGPGEFFAMLSINTILCSINPDFRSVVYCQAMSQGGKEEWNFLWQRYLNEIDPHEKFTLLQALACVKNEELVQRLVIC